ncbi:GntR family transcriptional regulator [Alteromonadaceae bacterium BrNp21-10]|nr:GntR family transcriptional regulator [Alteromonadaceae bacterium BrNp21-10]
MQISINIDDPVPLFSQLMTQIKAAVVDGHLNAGDALPSIRQLATDLQVNNKTVAKAYQLLERDSIIQTKGYRGTYIHPCAKENCGVDLSEEITRTLTNTIAELKDAGATDSEIRIAFGNVMNNRI